MWDFDQARDKSCMFLSEFHSPAHRRGSDLTSFFIRRSIYFGFSGREATFSTNEPDTSREETAAFDWRPAHLDLEMQEGEEDGRGMEVSSHSIEEKEARPEHLTQREREHERNLEQLQNNIATQKTRLLVSGQYENP